MNGWRASIIRMRLYEHQAPVERLPVADVRDEAERGEELAAAERVGGRELRAEEAEDGVDLGGRERGVAAADPGAGLAGADDEGGVVRVVVRVRGGVLAREVEQGGRVQAVFGIGQRRGVEGERAHAGMG